MAIKDSENIVDFELEKRSRTGQLTLEERLSTGQLTPMENEFLYEIGCMDEETKSQFKRFGEALISKNDITEALLKRFDKGRLTAKQLLAHF